MRETDPMLSGHVVEGVVGAPRALATIVGSELTESQANLRVYLTAGGLAILGLLLLLVTIWWWRGSRAEPTALAPLEVMSDRRWQRSTDTDRRRIVDRHRPEGAFALDGSKPEPEPIDLSEFAREQPASFDDLREPDVVDLAALVASVDASAGNAPIAADADLDHVPGDWHAAVEREVADERDEAERRGEVVIDPLLQRAATND